MAVILEDHGYAATLDSTKDAVVRLLANDLLYWLRCGEAWDPGPRGESIRLDYSETMASLSHAGSYKQWQWLEHALHTNPHSKR